jgi:hypothetical protein
MISPILLGLRLTLRGPVSALLSSAAPDERVQCRGSGGDASAPRHPQARCVPGLVHNVPHASSAALCAAVPPCGLVRGCQRAFRVENAGAASAEVQLAM